MLSSMETVIDVIRLLVAKARPALTDGEIALAHKILDDHEAAAKGLTPDPEGDAGAEAHG
jgi:hypothetical protein